MFSPADYVVLCKSNVVLPSGWARQLVDAGESDPTIGAISPLSNAANYQSVPYMLMEDRPKNDPSSWTHVEDMNHWLQMSMSISLQAIPVPILDPFFLAIKRKAVVGAGIQVRDFMVGRGAEVDSCFRLKLAGLTCAVATRLYVHHLKAIDFSQIGQNLLIADAWESSSIKYTSEILDRAVAVMKYGALTFVREQFASVVTTQRELPVKPIAFFSPQFDTFLLNVRAWREGFNDFIDDATVKPGSHCRDQRQPPKSPGCYNGSNSQRLRDQAVLAKENGIYGFAMFYYQTRSRLRKTHIELILNDPTINVKFFYCWDNANSLRSWDGHPENENIFMEQEYSELALFGVVEDVAIAAQDPNYITVKGDPVFMINSLAHIPELSSTLTWLREKLLERTGRNFRIGTRWCLTCQDESYKFVDFVVQSPPSQIRGEELPIIRDSENQRQAYLEDIYWMKEQSIRNIHSTPKLVPGVVLANMTTNVFQAWVLDAGGAAAKKHSTGLIPDNWLFVDVWNERSEAILDPTSSQGDEMLQALLTAVLALG